MTAPLDPFLPPLSDLVNSAQRALLYECIPPLPDVAGRICVVCDTSTDEVADFIQDGRDEPRRLAEASESGRRYRQIQLLGVGLLASPQIWLQHLSELPESRNYPADGAGSVYVIAWDMDGKVDSPVPDAQTVVNASLAVLESHPVSLGGGVACSVAGYQWVPVEPGLGNPEREFTSQRTGSNVADYAVSGDNAPYIRNSVMAHGHGDEEGSWGVGEGLIGGGAADHQTPDSAIGPISPDHWWTAAQQTAKPRRVWATTGWASWKHFLGIADLSALDDQPSALFTSWAQSGQLDEAPIQSAQDIAVMVAALDDPALRDAVLLAGAVPPVHEHIDLLDQLVESGDAAELANLLTAIFRGTQPPAWKHLCQAQGRVARLCRSAPARYRARCLAMIAWWAWFAGDVGRAHRLAATASLDDDSVRLAQLVTQACEFEVWPGWRRNQSQAS